MFDAIAALLRRGPSLSIPILDGALKPNNRLEDAPVFAARDGLDDLVLALDGTLYCTYDATVARVLDGGRIEPVAAYEAPVSALAVLPDGTIAAALGATVVIGSPADGHVVESADGLPFRAITALKACRDGTLLICDGSASHPCSAWSRDLLEKQRSGRLVHYDLGHRTGTTLASGLGYAFGVLDERQDRILVSESWRHQVSLVENGQAKPVVPALPGYPARMAPAEGGGFWLTLFACRTQLVEFVLRETDYRREMMRTIDPNHWVAPAFSSGTDFLEPLQGGSVKQMGILKPWAPPRSYGLVVRLTEDFIPVLSLHSRTGGRHHGIVAVAQRGDDLFVLSKGAGRILRLSLSGTNGLAA